MVAAQVVEVMVGAADLRVMSLWRSTRSGIQHRDVVAMRIYVLRCRLLDYRLGNVNSFKMTSWKNGCSDNVRK